MSANVLDGPCGISPLFFAAASPAADVPLLELLISHGADVNAVFEYGWSPLCACGYSLQKVRCLLHHGAEFYPGEAEQRRFPGSCSLETTEFLLQMGFDPTIKPGNGPSNLRFIERALDVDKLLLYEKYGFGRKTFSWNELMCEIVFGSTADLARFDIKTADLEWKDAWKRSPMLLSIRTGSVAKAKLLLEWGGSLDDKWHCEKSAIDCAIESSSSEMLMWLISLGADINSHGHGGTTPLMNAALYGKADAVQILLENRADVAAVDEFDQQAINFSIDTRSIRLLASAGADLNHVDGLGKFPLMNAVEARNLESVQVLIELGADANNHSFGYTALHQAANYDNLKIMELLLRAGADPNAAEDDGQWRPLWRAKSREAVQLLIDNGADLNLEDEFSHTAFSFHKDADFRDLLNVQ